MQPALSSLCERYQHASIPPYAHWKAIQCMYIAEGYLANAPNVLMLHLFQ